MDEYITVAQAAELENISERAVRMRVDNRIIQAKQAKCQSGAPGGKQWLVAIDSLSLPARQKWARRMAAAEEARQADADKEQAEQLPLPFTEEKAGVYLADGRTLNPAAVEETMGKERYEQAMREAGEKFTVVEKASAVIVSRDNVTERLRLIARDAGINLATLYRWLNSADKGVPGLIRRLPTVINGKKYRSISSDMESLIRAAYCRPGAPKTAAVIRKVDKFCQDNNLPAPSPGSVYRYIAHLEQTEAAMCCLSRDGYEAWLKNYAPHGKRAEPDRVMQIVMGDHHMLDFFCEYNNRPIRPWLTMWLDVKSRCPVGWTVADRANGQTIALALAHTMTPKRHSYINEETGEITDETIELGGLPETLYVDNGEDYKSRLKKPTKPKFIIEQKSLDLCSYLGIKVIFATAYHAEAKAHIERFFGTVAGMFSTLQPGWCGNKPENRPAGLDEYKLCEKGKLLSLTEVAERFDAWVFEEYLPKEHSSLNTAPIKAHLAGDKLKKGWPQPYTINMLRCVKDKARVYKDGIRKFGRLYWHEALDKYIGVDVIVRYDPAHLGEIYISTKQDGWICSAANAQLMQWDAATDDIKKINHRRKKAKQDLKERLNTDYEKYYSIEEAARTRKSAGENILPGAAGQIQGLMSAITPLDNIGRAAAREKNKPCHLKLVDNYDDPIRRMILGYSTDREEVN